MEIVEFSLLCVRKGGVLVLVSDKEKKKTGKDKIIFLHSEVAYAFVKFIVEQSFLRNTNVSERQFKNFQ